MYIHTALLSRHFIVISWLYACDNTSFTGGGGARVYQGGRSSALVKNGALRVLLMNSTLGSIEHAQDSLVQACAVVSMPNIREREREREKMKMRYFVLVSTHQACS
jgi:hypothetical protein